MTGRQIAERVAVVVLILIGSSGLGFGTYRLGQLESAKVAAAASERDKKIMDVIVKRNPQASVREFADFPSQFVREADAAGLDFRYVMALIDAESEWHPEAVSPKCAVGLMQVMPMTAKSVESGEFVPPVKDRAGKRCYESLGTLGEPLPNVRIGMRYLRAQIDAYGLGPEHLRAYNRGPGKATAHWPADRYAEDIALKFLALAATAGLPR